MKYVVRGVPQEIADEVRRTQVSPGYGHPAHLEVAGGTGPCRCCLEPFVPGKDRRLLFTYRPSGLFIHAEHCEAYNGEGFPDALRGLPLAFEARASHDRVTALSARDDESAEAQMQRLFDHDAQWLHVRHAEAGCFIARVEKL